MSLHLDYRINDLNKMTGNEITIKTIKSILERERKDIPHCFLFIGPGGSGKTTLARIVSKLLGCEPKASNQDFQEINAASSGGVDTARRIEETMRFYPVNKNSKARVYLLEEVHRSSYDFREAMLNKCMEFTPSHVYFLFCTTNPEKLGKASDPFRRRCHTFETKALKHDEICSIVNGVIKDQSVEEYFNEDIVNAIADETDGSAGSALALLDKIIDLDTEDMIDAIKISDQVKKQAYELGQALLNKDWNAVRKTLWDSKTKQFLIDEDPEAVRRIIRKFMQTVLLNCAKTDTDTFTRALLILMCFKDTFYATGKSGLVQACAEVFVE